MKRTLYTAQSRTKLFLILFSVVFATGLLAQPAASLSVQGVLTRSDGTAVDDGTYTVQFRLFDAPTGGNQVHSESIDVETIGGVYSVVLGANPSSPLTAQFNTIYYLSVTVGSSELTPRPRLTHAPYALSLIGQNNIFPSTGAVICDALTVAGAVSASSYGSVNASSVTASGAVNANSVNASSVTASGAVNGNQFVASGGAPSIGVAGRGYSFNNTGDQDGGLFSIGDNNVRLYANGVAALEANSSGVNIFGYVRSGGGYAFTNDDDSGMYSSNDGTIRLQCNGTQVMFANTSGFNITRDLYLTSAPNMTDGDNLEWRSNVQGGRVGVNTSSRRYKYNIQPLKVDFTRILKVQPRTYNRISEGDDKWEIGYIAEEIDSLGMKDLVLYDLEGRPNSLIYKKIVIYTNEVVKMHHAEIENLNAVVAALSAEINQLRTVNNGLRTTNTALQEQQTAIGAQLEALSRRIKLLETMAESR